MTGRSIRVHATCVALPDADGGWSGVLLRGPSGAGKSDLALRLIDDGARLVADDQTELRPVDDALLARAPQSILGKIEARGIGIVDMPHMDDVPLRLVCDLVGHDGDRVARLPDPGVVRLADIELPLVALAPFEASAPAKLRLVFGSLLKV